MLPSIDQVTALIRATAEDIILPRFQNLADGEVGEKRGGEIVTIADREAEARLAKEFRALVTGSTVVGEEDAEANPEVLKTLAGDAPVWLIDPVDGTRNFANGIPCFAVIVAYCHAGRARAAWIHDPVANATVVAEEGGGSWEAGDRLRIRKDISVGEMTGVLGGNLRQRIEDRRASGDKAVPRAIIRLRCAGQQYMGLVRGTLQFSRYGQLKPWDHAGGILIHREAGGYDAFMQAGRGAYSPEPGIVQGPILLAPSEESWTELHEILAGGA